MKLIIAILNFFGSLFRKDNEEDIVVDENATEKENNNIIMSSRYSKIRVEIDRGHASTTPGKKSTYLCSGVEPKLALYEWKFNREVGDIIARKLIEKGFSVNIINPEDDVDVPLKTRYQRANEDAKKTPDMFHILISVHANAHGKGDAWTSARGWSAYTTKGQNKSDKLAECLYNHANEIIPSLGSTIRRDTTDGDQDFEENFTIIYGANMPAVLTENLFYTNIKDTEILLSDRGKEAIAEIHVRGIIDFSEKYLLS